MSILYNKLSRSSLGSDGDEKNTGHSAHELIEEIILYSDIFVLLSIMQA